jgi:hypothetical protein
MPVTGPAEAVVVVVGSCRGRQDRTVGTGCRGRTNVHQGCWTVVVDKAVCSVCVSAVAEPECSSAD